MKNLAIELIKHKRITTTLAKAKALRVYVEPLLTRGKENTTHNRRVVFTYLQDKDSIKTLFNEIGGKIADRPGGYTRIIKLGTRVGDNAEIALIELVDYNENLLQQQESGSRKRRTRRAGRSKTTSEGEATAASPTAEAEVKEKEKAEETEPVTPPSAEATDQDEEKKG